MEYLGKIDGLYQEIRNILERSRSTAYRAVNVSMVHAYWHIGRLIVENEQKGEERAEYGKAILKGVSKRLTSEFGKGYTVRNLRYMRQFFLAFSKRNALRSESRCIEKRNVARSVFLEGHAKRSDNSIQALLRPELSWTHYRLLLRVENDKAREWYMNEAADMGWSTRQLERQISTLYFDRLMASREKEPVKREAEEKMSSLEPEYYIRDPYVLEFLNLEDYPSLRESTLEQAIIDKLQQFLLELGKGFSFVARQKRMRFDDKDFYVDSVFYNFFLKCFVLIDLKIGELTHQDIGQMDGYVRMFEEHGKVEGDNPTIGLILCSEKNAAIARYSVLNNSKQLFASKYKLYLPTEKELEKELKQERKLIEERHFKTDS